MIKAIAIDHVCLWVRSLPEAKAYYENLLGVTCTPRAGDPDTLVAESDSIHFFISENRADDGFLSRQHLSFEVASLDQVIGSLEASGISDYRLGEVGFFKYRNYKWCEWLDPSGIRLECVELIRAPDL